MTAYPDKSDAPMVWLTWCREKLADYASMITDNPMTNSVQRLSHDLAVLLERGDLSLESLGAISSALGDDALMQRANRFADAHQSRDPNAPSWLDDKSLDFAGYKQAAERTVAGIVFTGHPTFAIARAIRQDFTKYVDGIHGGDTPAPLKVHCHCPDETLTLGDEHEDVAVAIAHANNAVGDLTAKILDEARNRFPDDWHRLTPQPISVATWVGYDLDGRTDIHWAQTLTIRLNEKATQLASYANSLSAITNQSGTHPLAGLAEQLAGACELTRHQANLFAGDLNDPAVVTKAANALSEQHADKMVSLTPAIEQLSTYIQQNPDDDHTRDLCLLRARMSANGLGLARIHLRVNAAQVRSALRHDFDVQSDAHFIGRSTLERATLEARDAGEHDVNFAAVFLEQMTARRQFMLCAQILKHVDADTPIRFLIAECEAPATVMGAVYLARAYGVAEKLDISPLFETPSAMERGGRFLEHLLKEQPFLDYIAKRKRISIQLGFSDSGRFMGQIAADLAIERLHILLARALSNANVTNVEALIFNTNGESMGRGTPPGDLEWRLHHLMTPWARSRFARANIPTNVESSFQGGEGFLHFNSPAIAEKTVSQIFEVSSRNYSDEKGDAFYDDINFSWDFYRSLKIWQEDLFQHPDYSRAISTFAHRFLFVTGSRKARRQKNGTADMSPSALRAIPHNAILQQLAIPANVAGGIGTSVSHEADRFVAHVAGSPRMKTLIAYAARARDLTSLPAFMAYANIYNATYWTRRSAGASDPVLGPVYQSIANQVECQNVFTALSRLANHLAVDLSKFDDVLEVIYGKDRATVRREDRIDLHVLHAVRQALIMHGLALVAKIPPFSGRHEVSRSDLLDLALGLQFDEVAVLMDDIFPVVRPEVQALSGILEPTTIRYDDESGYPAIQHEIKEPIVRIHRLIKEIGVCLSHSYGAYG